MKNNPILYLLESSPRTKYKTLTNLMDLPSSSSEAKIAKQKLNKKNHRLGLHSYVVRY